MILREVKTFLQTHHPFLLRSMIGMLLLHLQYRSMPLGKAPNVNLENSEFVIFFLSLIIKLKKIHTSFEVRTFVHHVLEIRDGVPELSHSYQQQSDIMHNFQSEIFRHVKISDFTSQSLNFHLLKVFLGRRCPIEGHSK